MTTYTIKSQHTKSLTIADPDGYEVSFDGAGVAVVDDPWAAGYFGGLAHLGYSVDPQPAPLAALPPRPPVAKAAPPPVPVRPDAGQWSGDLGVELDPGDEHIPSVADVRNPQNSPIVPEVAAEVLRERYPDVSDRAILVRGLLGLEEFLEHIIRDKDAGERLRVLSDLFPETVERLRVLERQANESAANEAALKTRIAELEELTKGSGAKKRR